MSGDTQPPFAFGTRGPEFESRRPDLYRTDREMFDAQPMRALCLLCDWTFEGTAASARESFREHRAAVHPETLRRGRARTQRIASADIVTVCTRTGCSEQPTGEGEYPSLCWDHADVAAENRANRPNGKRW